MVVPGDDLYHDDSFKQNQPQRGEAGYTNTVTGFKVTDPVTGNTRKISAFSAFPGPPTIRFFSDNDYVVDIAFRQDLEAARWAWGVDTAFQADRQVYKVNELENFEEGVEFNAFVETTRWFGVKIRLEGRNLTNYLEVRDRLSYTGRREISPIQRREFRLRKPNRIFTLTMSGSFNTRCNSFAS